MKTYNFQVQCHYENPNLNSVFSEQIIQKNLWLRHKLKHISNQSYQKDIRLVVGGVSLIKAKQSFEFELPINT